MIFRQRLKILKIFGSLWKCLENFGNARKIFERDQRFTKILKTFLSLTVTPVDLRSDSRILICNLQTDATLLSRDRGVGRAGGGGGHVPPPIFLKL